jgi:hypothetical protein
MKHRNFILFIVLTFFLSPEFYSENINTLKFALVYPELTKEVLYKNDGSFKPTDDWEIFFMSNHLKYEMINDNSIDEIKDDIDVVIFPSTEAVTEDLIEGIEELLNRGKGILITGNFAVFDEEGSRINTDLQYRILDFRITRLPDVNEISINHTLIGNTPFSIDLMPGTKILLKQKPGLYFASGPSGMCSNEGYYFPVNKNFTDTISGIISENKFSGRLLWLGCNFDQLIGENRDKFLMNSFNWLSPKPVAFINDLPGDYLSVTIIYRYIEKQKDINSGKTLADSNKISYFVSPIVFENSGSKIKDLNNGGTLNILWDNFFFSKLSPEKKEKWLIQTKYLIKEITGQDYTGIASYGELYDSSDYRYLSDTGYSFNFYSGYGNSFFIDNNSVRNIYSFINQSIPGKDYHSGLNFILNNNGIIYLNADSLKANENYFKDLVDKHLWITTFSDLLKWMAKKGQLKISGDFVDNEYKISIWNNGSDDIHNLSVWISAPFLTSSLYIKNTYSDGKMTFEPDIKMYNLKIDFIPGKGNVSFTIAGITR